MRGIYLGRGRGSASFEAVPIIEWCYQISRALPMDPPPPPPPLPPMLLYVHSWPVATLVQIVSMFNLFMQTFGIFSEKEHLTSHYPPFGPESKTYLVLRLPH